jgi:CheY-like chemotaxis protein
VDLTRRKRLEEALLESDRRKNEFLATLAHELRNPLAPVRYAAKVLDLKGPTNRETQWAVQLIERQTKHMARLIDDLLDISRISRNTLELRKESVELATVIATAVETAHPYMKRDGHELFVTIPSQPIYLLADPVRLAQVFSNLLDNAAKYSKHVDVAGKIWLTAVQEGLYAVVRVKDTGIGIAPEMLPKIFEMFTQVGRSIRQSEGGLGIGLSLAKRLVEMHGGNIDVSSEGLGKGSEFVVRIPLAQGSRNESMALVEGSSIAEQPILQRRILIADDNPDVVETFEVMLQTLGYEVQTALDGIEALEKAEQFQPHAIVLDLGMPKLDGYETAKRIRQRPWGQDVVLVAVTGWGNENDKLKSADAGFNMHLVKPIDATILLQYLNKTE